MKTKGWLLIILFVGLVLRCLLIDTRSINYDDAFSVFLSRQSLPEIVSGTAADTMPPLYYFLLHLWMSFGQDLWWLRLLSVVLSIGIIYLTYHLTAGLAGETAGLWAAMFTALSPFQIYHAQDLRMYALLGISQLGYFTFLARIWKREPTPPTWADWLGVILCGTAAMYSHNLAIFGLIVADVFLLLKKEWKKVIRLVCAQLVIGILALPWLWMLPGQVEKIQRAFWTPRPGIAELVQAILIFHVQLPLSGIWMILGLGISILVFVLVLFETWRIRKKNQQIDILIAILFILPLLLFIVSYIIRPVFVPRGFILSSLGYYGLLGVVTARGWKKGIGKVLIGLMLVAALISLPAYYRFESFPRSPFREATELLKDKFQAGDLVIHDNKLSYLPMHFFDPNLPQTFIMDEPGSHNDTFALPSQQAMKIFPAADLETAAEGAYSLYFVTFQETIQEYQNLGMEQHPALAWLYEQYQYQEKISVGDIEIFHFAKDIVQP